MKFILEKSIALSVVASLGFTLWATPQRFRHVTTGNSRTAEHSLAVEKIDSLKKAILNGDTITDDTLVIRTPSQIIFDTQIGEDIPRFNRLTAPWVFTRYRDLSHKTTFRIPEYKDYSEYVWSHLPDTGDAPVSAVEEAVESLDSTAARQKYLDSLWGLDTVSNRLPVEEIFEKTEITEPERPSIMGNARPAWLQNAFDAWKMQEDMMYRMMVDDPRLIEYAYWMLPVPPKLPDDEKGFKEFLKRAAIRDVKADDAEITQFEIGKTHWLHVVNGALQFSQAYLSKNWYQGGNNYLSMLFNFLWDVQLNPVHHPKFLFQSTLSYKLGLNSVKGDTVHRYSISQDVFQYNLKMGYKALSNWYYSMNAQFKTQLLNHYPSNSRTRIASFLTPADLNFGLGMTYNKVNKKRTFQFDASISPLSYNLKTAIDHEVNHELFGLSPTQKCKSTFGSNAEITMNWQIWKNINYRTRLWLFTDYKTGLGDWENTFNFQFNKFFSTQLFFNLRYDSSHGRVEGCDWNHWMLKEIMSVGLSYTFSTK